MMEITNTMKIKLPFSLDVNDPFLKEECSIEELYNPRGYKDEWWVFEAKRLQDFMWLIKQLKSKFSVSDFNFYQDDKNIGYYGLEF